MPSIPSGRQDIRPEDVDAVVAVLRSDWLTQGPAVPRFEAALAAKLESAEAQGRLPKVIVPVHFAGQSCDMQRIRALADRYGFRIVEDAAHAIGGKYLGMPIGGCRC